MKDFRLSRNRRKTLNGNMVVRQDRSNLVPITARHAAQVKLEQQKLNNAGKAIEMAQSMRKFKENGKDGLQTMLCSVDEIVYIRTYSDGKSEIWKEPIYEENVS